MNQRERRLRLACWAVVLGGIAASLYLRRALFGGVLFADDLVHYAMRAGLYPVERGPLDLFNFISGDPAEREALLRFGSLPWWSAPNIQLAALRPLSSALVTLDYGPLGGDPLLLHLHSVAWWLVLVAGVAALLREVLPRGVAALAVVLYALDEAHGLPLSWIAHRSSVVALALGTWGLWSHVAYRMRGARPGAWLSIVLVALAIAAGEHAFAVLAYFAAFELVAARDAWSRRARALLPVAALAATYALAHRWLGYGMVGSGFYVDPLEAPLRYFAAFPERVSLLVGDVALGFGAEWASYGMPYARWLEDAGAPADWFARPRWRLTQLLLCVVALALVGSLAWRLFRRGSRGREQDDALRWLLSGAVLSLLPMTTTLPMSRLTGAAAIGASAVIATLIHRGISAWRGDASLRRRIAGLTGACALGAVHLLYTAHRAETEASFIAERSRVEQRVIDEAPLGRDAPKQDVFVLTARAWALQWGLPSARLNAGLPVPRSSHLLSAVVLSPHRLTRESANAFVLEVLDEPEPRSFRGSVYRADDLPLRAGETRRMRRFDVTVLAARDGAPTRMRFDFGQPLEHPRYVFAYSSEDELRQLHMPAIGESIDLPAP